MNAKVIQSLSKEEHIFSVTTPNGLELYLVRFDIKPGDKVYWVDEQFGGIWEVGTYSSQANNWTVSQGNLHTRADGQDLFAIIGVYKLQSL